MALTDTAAKAACLGKEVQQRAWSLAALPEELLLQKAASAVLQMLAGQATCFCSVFRALQLLPLPSKAHDVMTLNRL